MCGKLLLIVTLLTLTHIHISTVFRHSTFYHHKVFFLLLSLLRAGVQPTLDPSAETISRSYALAQGERRRIENLYSPVAKARKKLVGVCECVRDVQGR